MEQTKTHRTKSKAAKTMNLLSAIESVAVSAKDSQLCDQFFVDRKTELKFLADSYGITPLQATLFCVCMERGPHRIDFDDDALLKDILRPDTTDELVLADTMTVAEAEEAINASLVEDCFVDIRATGSYNLTADLPLKEIRKPHMLMINNRRGIEELKKKLEAPDEQYE